MKKLMSTMLALALVAGTATVTFAQADDTKKATTKKGKGSKKNKDDKGDTKSGDAKAKKGSKKGKDAKDAPTK